MTKPPGRPRTRPDTPTNQRRRAADRAANSRNAAAVREWLTVYKLLKGCQVCGYGRSAKALVFHHRDPADKLFNVGGSNWSIAWERTEAEIAKTDVLCACCHAEHHDPDFTQGAKGIDP